VAGQEFFAAKVLQAAQGNSPAHEPADIREQERVPRDLFACLEEAAHRAFGHGRLGEFFFFEK